MGRDKLHDLVDRVPEAERASAMRFLAYVAAGPAYRASLLAHAAAIARASEDVRAGNATSHDEILRGFGLR
jgi:hypothetical protein